ncbi:MAG: serine hydrolase [Hyphomonas sp.]|uniref:serine hydrolase domain-containing protein n=1 Tax=Hyphomonas sp. TaxID=87 RepID=UPI003526EA85
MENQTAGDAPPAVQLFSGQRQYEAFARIREFTPVAPMAPSSHPFQFGEGPAIELPETYMHEGVAKPLRGLIEDTDTSALLVLKDGIVRYEEYLLTGGRGVQWISMSVAKSFISALIGIARAEGKLGSLEDPISDHVPALKGSGYDGVSIRHVLQMSSGVRWREDYGDPNSEISRMSAALAPGGSLDAFMTTMVREFEPGTVCQYSSADTQALGMLIRAVTGTSIAAYMQEKLCEPLGMEAPSFWIVDGQGAEMAFAGILMTARDFAKIGELYRHGGAWQGAQIVPADYVADSVKLAAPHLAPGRPLVGGYPFGLGYGYQWWLPDGDQGDFSAIGVYNQYVYVDPSRGVVIVKLSANPAYGTSHDDADNKDVETVSALRAIARVFD